MLAGARTPAGTRPLLMFGSREHFDWRGREAIEDFGVCRTKADRRSDRRSRAVYRPLPGISRSGSARSSTSPLCAGLLARRCGPGSPSRSRVPAIRGNDNALHLQSILKGIWGAPLPVQATGVVRLLPPRSRCSTNRLAADRRRGPTSTGSTWSLPRGGEDRRDHPGGLKSADRGCARSTILSPNDKGTPAIATGVPGRSRDRAAEYSLAASFTSTGPSSFANSRAWARAVGETTFPSWSTRMREESPGCHTSWRGMVEALGLRVLLEQVRPGDLAFLDEFLQVVRRLVEADADDFKALLVVRLVVRPGRSASPGRTDRTTSPRNRRGQPFLQSAMLKG